MLRLTRTVFCFQKAKTAETFKSLRVYKQMSDLELVNALFVNRASNSKWLVANSSRLYRLSCKFLSSYFVNRFIQSTFGKVFTAGQTTQDVTQMMDYFQRMKIPVIVDFSGEGFMDQTAIESQLDKNAAMFKHTAQVAIKYPDQLISVKVTALVDVPTLMRLNAGRLNIHKLWERAQQNGKLTGVALLKDLQKIDGSITEQDISQFVEEIFGKGKDIGKFECDKTDFLMNVHPYYVFEDRKNSNRIIKLMCPMSKEDVKRIQNLIRRMDYVIKDFVNNTQGFRITLDAEQSYIQEAINSIAEQYQAKYNTQKVYLIPTFQNYLKNSNQRMDYQIEIAHRRNLYFGAKHVRGAYLVEERRLAQQKGQECPIVQSFDQTTKNYMRNTRLGLTDPHIRKQSEMIIASHNQETISQIQSMMRDENNGSKLYFAQLQGLADHLTIQLHKQGYNVYKYLPYGATDTMVPYLIRRAQQLSQMRYPLTLQYQLIVDQFKTRARQMKL